MSQVKVVFGEVGVKDPTFHLTSECESIPAAGSVGMSWEVAKELVMLPRFCEACGPFARMGA